MQYLSKIILKMLGWKTVLSVTEPANSVICVAPHTSNFDFIFGKLAYASIGRDASFLIKKSWFFFPMNLFFKAIGGVPIDRTRKSSVTDQMAEEFAVRKHFHLAITPEGTRRLVNEWKMGFYFIAQKAGVPIQLAYIDYQKKEVGIKQLFYPTGNIEKDMSEIYNYYKGVKGKHPEKFNL